MCTDALELRRVNYDNTTSRTYEMTIVTKHASFPDLSEYYAGKYNDLLVKITPHNTTAN